MLRMNNENNDFIVNLKFASNLNKLEISVSNINAEIYSRIGKDLTSFPRKEFL
jgi:tetrahydromethanopterin S-methyltransferase subunit G